MRIIVILFMVFLGACSDNNSPSIPVDPPSPEVNLPIANAGQSIMLQRGATAVLNGSGSYDPEGAQLTYRWSIVSVPSGSSSQLSDETSPFPSIYLDAVGRYEVQLVVNNGSDDSQPSTVVISDTDSLPIANAGPDRRAKGSEPIMLDGSLSSDSDGDRLTYKWSIVSAPTGSTALLAKSDTPFAVLAPDVAGDYEIQLVVNDGNNDSLADTVLISEQNVPPVANAGPSQTYQVGSNILFNGSRSSDADGDALTYKWGIVSAPTNSKASLVDATTAQPSITPDISGDYIISLVVNDGLSDSAVSTTILHRSNQVPVANAGRNLSSRVGQLVHLDGTASTDGDGDSIEPRWSIVSKPKSSLAKLGDVHTFHPQLTPDVVGDYVVQLMVYDGQYLSAASTVTVSTSNLPPVANAGVSQIATTGQLIHLDGSNSTDPEGGNLSYQWSVVAIPSGSVATLSDTAVVSPSFTPDTAGDFIFQLVVSDGSLSSAPATVIVTDRDLPPIARAGNDQSVATSVTATLDGSSSSDPELQPLSYQWVLLSSPSGSGTVIINATHPIATLTPDRTGDYVAQLTVTDIAGQTARDVVVIRDPASNTLPVANAGKDFQVDLGTNVVLDGSGSMDADGDALVYSWAILSRPTGSLAKLNNSASRNPDFTPDIEGDFVIQLVVSDGKSTSLPDIVMIHDKIRNLAPTAYISSAPDGTVGQVISLDGQQSSDPNGDSLTYKWALILPANSASMLSDSSSVAPTFTPDVSGFYVATLTVSDGLLQSTLGTKVIIVNEPAKGSAISVPAGHNLMMLSATGGESGTGALISINESNLSKATELLSFHGLPGLNSYVNTQSLVAHPTDGHLYVLIGETGLYGRGALLKYNPVSHSLELLTSIPEMVVGGNVVRDVRGTLLFHPDGKTAYAIAEIGGVNNSGVVIQIDTDPKSANYLAVRAIADFGQTGTNYLGYNSAPEANLNWNNGNLLTFFGRSRREPKRPGIEIIPSDPSDLSKSWSISAFGESIWVVGRHITVENDTVVHFTSDSPPILDATGRNGSTGVTVRDCLNPLGTFYWRDPQVFGLCRGSGSQYPPTLYETNMVAGSANLRRSFSNWVEKDLVGLVPSSIRDEMYITVNDESAVIFRDMDLSTVGFPITPPYVSQITKPNYSDRPVIMGGGDRGFLFVGDPAIYNDPNDPINDRFISVLSYNGGDNKRGAILTYDRADSSVTNTSLGFGLGGFPFGRISKISTGDYFFAVSDGERGFDSGRILRYDSVVGSLQGVDFPQLIRPGLNTVESSSGTLYGLGINLRFDNYVLYSIDANNLGFQEQLTLGTTQEHIPSDELTIDSDNLWFFTGERLNCVALTSNATAGIDLVGSGPHDPVRSVVFASAGADGYFATRGSAIAGEGTIQRVSNDCSMPLINTVVSGLVDHPSTALLAASDGNFYFGTEGGKLMKFDGATAPTLVADFTGKSVVGFLTEDANGDIIGVLSNGTANEDELFAYTIIGGATKKQTVPTDRPIDSFYPGVTEID